VRKYIKAGEESPKWYGLAWLDFAKNQHVVYPIPLNWFARWIRDLYYFLAVPKRKTYMEKLEHEIASGMFKNFEQNIRSEVSKRLDETFEKRVKHEVALHVNKALRRKKI